MDDLATLYSILTDFVLQIVMTVPGLRHVLDNGTIIFPPFPATDLEPSLHQQGLCRVQHQTWRSYVELGKVPV